MKNRTGLVVFVDILMVLIFVIAVRNIESVPQFEISNNNEIDLVKGLVVARYLPSQKSWEIYTSGRWRAVGEDEKWRDSVISVACDERCKKYGISDLSNGAYLVVNKLAHDIGMIYFNKCRSANPPCRKVLFTIDGNKLEETIN